MFKSQPCSRLQTGECSCSRTNWIAFGATKRVFSSQCLKDLRVLACESGSVNVDVLGMHPVSVTDACHLAKVSLPFGFCGSLFTSALTLLGSVAVRF